MEALARPISTVLTLFQNVGEQRNVLPIGCRLFSWHRRRPASDLSMGRCGVVGFGGPIVTSGGLVFIAAAWDAHFRAFDVKTEKELRKAQLLPPGVATPMTYRVPSIGEATRRDRRLRTWQASHKTRG